MLRKFCSLLTICAFTLTSTVHADGTVSPPPKYVKPAEPTKKKSWGGIIIAAAVTAVAITILVLVAKDHKHHHHHHKHKKDE